MDRAPKWTTSNIENLVNGRCNTFPCRWTFISWPFISVRLFSAGTAWTILTFRLGVAKRSEKQQDHTDECCGVTASPICPIPLSLSPILARSPSRPAEGTHVFPCWSQPLFTSTHLLLSCHPLSRYRWCWNQQQCTRLAPEGLLHLV